MGQKKNYILETVPTEIYTKKLIYLLPPSDGFCSGSWTDEPENP